VQYGMVMLKLPLCSMEEQRFEHRTVGMHCGPSVCGQGPSWFAQPQELLLRCAYSFFCLSLRKKRPIKFEVFYTSPVRYQLSHRLRTRIV
jgi:hypothetical protein